MHAFPIGSSVEIRFYGAGHETRSVQGKIDYVDPVGVTILTVFGDLHFYPWSSVQRMILLES